RTDPALQRPVTGIIVVSLLGAGLHAALLVPAYAGEHATGPTDLVVLNLNLKRGHADAAGTVALARREQAQLVVLEEVTVPELGRLHRAGIGDTFPHEAGRPG